MQLAAASSVGQGMPNIPVAVVPGHPGVQSAEELRRNILEVTLDRVIDNLLGAPAAATDQAEPGPFDIVFKGTLDEVDEFFLAQEYSDGLPVRPPTIDKVQAFLRYTDLQPEHSLGVLPADSRSATVWSIAVNGVMAGCRPEYMPVLVALIEAIADPYYGLEHSGNTPGSETLIVVNGPIVKQLGFNFTQGVMRDGFQANTSIGRFLRLYLRNVAGFLPHRNDKATFGNTWRVVVAENEDVSREIGWTTLGEDMGFAESASTLTISRFSGGAHVGSVSGSTPEEMMPYLADAVLRQTSWHMIYSIGPSPGVLRPMVFLSPILAETMAAAGWSKQDFQRALYRDARVPAFEMERMIRDWNLKPLWNIAEQGRLGRVPREFNLSDDPKRLVPICWEPEDFMVVVTGDPARNSAYVFAHNGVLGYPVAKEIKLPKGWKAMLKRSS